MKNVSVAFNCLAARYYKYLKLYSVNRQMAFWSAIRLSTTINCNQLRTAEDRIVFADKVFVHAYPRLRNISFFLAAINMKSTCIENECNKESKYHQETRTSTSQNRKRFEA